MATVSFNTQFDVANQLIIVEDTADYTGLTIANCRGYIRVQLTTSEGTVTVYDNLYGVSPDINPNVSLFNTTSIPLPFEAITEAPLKGEYIISYRVSDSVAMIDIGIAVNTYQYDFDYPEACLDVNVNCSASTITSKDVTDYGEFASTIVRTHTLYPPPSSGASTLTAALQTIVYTNIYTTTWTAEISSEVTFDFGNGLTMIATIDGVKEFKVDCDTNLCKITCCLQTLYEEYNDLLTSNPTRAGIMKRKKIDPVTELLVLFLVAQNCGDIDKLAELKTEIETVSGCNDNCGCSTGKPVLVVAAAGSGSNIIVDSPDNSIDVTPQVVGSTTYYHIQVSAIIQNIINNLQGSIVVASANPISAAYIAVTSTGTNPKTYTITYTPSTGQNPNWIELYLVINATTRTLTRQIVYSYGDKIAIVGSQNYAFYPVVPAATDFIVITGNSFLNILPTEFTVKANVMNNYFRMTQPEVILQIPQLKYVEADVMWTDNASGSFYLRLYSPVDGHILTYAELAADPDSSQVAVCVQIQGLNNNLIKLI